MVPLLADMPMYRSTTRRQAVGGFSPDRCRRTPTRRGVSGYSCRRPRRGIQLAEAPASPELGAFVTAGAQRQAGSQRQAGAKGSPHRASDRRAVLWYRRTVAIGLVAVVLMCSWIGIRAALGRTGGGPLATTGAPSGALRASPRVWIVHSGETLWSIAEAIDPDGDIRPLVDRLASEAGGTAIYPGETIAIPGR